MIKTIIKKKKANQKVRPLQTEFRKVNSESHLNNTTLSFLNQ